MLLAFIHYYIISIVGGNRDLLQELKKFPYSKLFVHLDDYNQSKILEDKDGLLKQLKY